MTIISKNQLRKSFKHLGLFTSLGSLALLLSGCVRTDSSGHPYGMVYHYLAIPGQHIMNWLATFVGSYGWALIVLTAIVRIILMPLMISQMKKATTQQEKMSYIKPQLKIIQKNLRSAKTQTDRIKANQQMMALYRNNHISLTGGIGCLPLLIQLPVFAGLYAAIRYSPQLSHTTFMGISLGQKSIILAILSGLIYVLQAYISLIGIPQNQKKQMKMMLFFSPVMILIVTLSSPAGLGIYFFIGGVFACLQTLIINLYRPKIRAAVARNVKKHPIKKIKLTPQKETTSTKNPKTDKQPSIVQIHKENRKRNQGKQNLSNFKNK